MHKLLLLPVLVSVLGTASATELYRCDNDGTVLYTDRACADGSAPIGNLPEKRPAPAPGRDAGNNNVNVEVNSNIDVSTGDAASAPLPAGPARGLEFRDFRRLERGQSEAEVLAIAGPPDNEVVDGVNTELGLTSKSFYYVSEGYNANITRIRFTNGTVTDLERTLRPF